MEEEILALKQNQTWDLVLKPESVKPISCKWVYKLEIRLDGTIERYKVRLVIQGFSQEYRIDYDEIFSPVAKIITVLVLLSLAARFLNREKPDYVCKLKKVLYGLKQSPKAWYGKIAEFLVQSGYHVAPVDLSLFVKAGGKLSVVLCICRRFDHHWRCTDEIQRARENLSFRFQMNELGDLNHFLLLEVERSDRGMFPGQQNYATDILQKFALAKCKPISTSMEPNLKLCINDGKDLEDTTMYRQISLGISLRTRNVDNKGKC
ncbi:transmembrane signal receptor [Lithospermum erythrorhizon]|uniref:Transmembrane signal receptor n=1 Tax=Lithospermum erythrorhizon TaxID=34254 RepID=A0AAV3R0M2_LITER